MAKTSPWKTSKVRASDIGLVRRTGNSHVAAAGLCLLQRQGHRGEQGRHRIGVVREQADLGADGQRQPGRVELERVADEHARSRSMTSIIVATSPAGATTRSSSGPYCPNATSAGSDRRSIEARVRERLVTGVVAVRLAEQLGSCRCRSARRRTALGGGARPARRRSRRGFNERAVVERAVSASAERVDQRLRLAADPRLRGRRDTARSPR